MKTKILLKNMNVNQVSNLLYIIVNLMQCSLYHRTFGL